MIEHPSQSLTLSSPGEARREAMRQLLLREVDRRRGRRRLRRAGAAGGAAAAAVAALAWALWPVTPAATPPGLAPVLVRDGPHPSVRVRFESVRASVSPDDPRIVRGPGREVAPIGDDELILLLQRAGHPGGIIRSGGAVVLTAAIPPLGDDAAHPGS